MDEKVKKDLESKFNCEKCNCQEIEEKQLDDTTVQIICKGCKKILGFGKKIKIGENQNPEEVAQTIIQKMREKFGKENVGDLEKINQIKMEESAFEDEFLKDEFRKKIPEKLRKMFDETEGFFEKQGFKIISCCRCIYCGKYFKQIPDVKKHIKLEHNQNGR